MYIAQFWKNYAEQDYFGEWTPKKYQVVNQVWINLKGLAKCYVRV